MRFVDRYGTAVATCLMLAACGPSTKEATPEASTGPRVEVVELPHGTIAAVPGSAEEQLAKFLASNDPAPRTFRFGADQFAPWSDQLSIRSRATLSNITLILRDYSTSSIKLVGYTDDDGPADKNQVLSERRVETLKRLLVNGGIAGSRITTVGKGAADPIAANDTAAGRILNRRTEITITSK